MTVVQREVISPGLELIFPDQQPSGEAPEPIQPPFCSRCGHPYPGMIDPPFVCSNCTSRRWNLDAARAPYRMSGQVREAIHGFKYEGKYYWIRQLSRWLETGYENLDVKCQWDAIVPVPLHHRRRRDRGFNQAQSLAEALGHRVKLPVWNCLSKSIETPHQALLTRALRLRNLRKSIVLQERFDVKAKSLLLLDDVFTTGATADACATVLKAGGASKVVALTIARG